MTAPLVSLVTPTYNQAEYLAATIESVLAQTYPALDYRVIDDGSTDATPAVLARYTGRVAWERQANAGQAATLNRAWAEARGDYLGYLSSDDLLAPGAIARCAAVLDAEPETVCVYPNSNWIDPAGRVIRRAVARPFDLAHVVVSQECPIGPGALFRADAFRRAGGWRPELRLGPDREFWMRLALLGRFRFIEEPLAGYRMQPGSISFSQVSEAKSQEFLRVLDGWFARDDVPPAIRARRAEAYGRAHLLVARNCVMGRDWAGARRHWREARRLHPPLAGSATWAMLARASVGRPVRLFQARLRALMPRASARP